MANSRIEQLKARIDSLKAEGQDIGQRWDELLAEFLRAWEATGKALDALRIEGSHRRKAEALQSIVDKILCHFRHQEMKERSAKSYLNRVEIVPAECPPVICYPNATSPRRSRFQPSIQGFYS